MTEGWITAAATVATALLAAGGFAFFLIDRRRQGSLRKRELRRQLAALDTAREAELGEIALRAAERLERVAPGHAGAEGIARTRQALSTMLHRGGIEAQADRERAAVERRYEALRQRLRDELGELD